MPAAREAAARWLDQLRTGEIPVRVHLSELEGPTTRLESVPRLIAVAIVLAGLLIGSAVAASIGTGGDAFRTDLRNVALVLFVIAMVIATAFVVTLLWRLIRPNPRRRQRET
jgi:hypothetical protein